jgi:hypothetical protein
VFALRYMVCIFILSQSIFKCSVPLCIQYKCTFLSSPLALVLLLHILLLLHVINPAIHYFLLYTFSYLVRRLKEEAISFIFANLFIVSGALYFPHIGPDFLLFQVPFYLRISFNVSCNAALLVMNSFSF